MKFNKTIATTLLCAVVCGCTAYGVQSGLSAAAAATESVSTQAAVTSTNDSANTQVSAASTNDTANTKSAANTNDVASTSTSTAQTVTAKTEASVSTFSALTTLIDTSNLFTERDLEQTADSSDATQITLIDGQDVTISSEGVYFVTGSASNVTIIVDAADTDKVQIVLNGVTITNDRTPAIYVKSADKVFVTIVGDNALSTTDAFSADGTTNTDAVIFSKSDLVLNGIGSLTITSTANGISGKDDLKFTGGTYTITAAEDAVEAHDSIRISDGSFTINAKKDAFHSEDDEDDSVGYIYIAGGTFEITAGDDGIQGTTYTIIDGGTISITASEGIEGTGVQINGGNITINASDDGINGASKTSKFSPFIEINDGVITVNMGQGDTDAIDCNGNLTINGGTIDITAQSAFDYDGTGTLNGGTITVNGSAVTALTQTGPGGGRGGFQNGNGGFGGHGGHF